MKFFRYLLCSTLCTLYFVLCTSLVKAENEFSIDSVTTYDFQASGKALITHDITLENNVSDLYATSYSLVLENISIQNVKAVGSNGTVYETQLTKSDNKTNVKITFPDSVTGKNKQRHFYINYENNGFAVKTGEIWEVTIPRLSQNDNYRNYQVAVKIPANFGLEAYISPNPYRSERNGLGNTYVFNKDGIAQTGITAGFGQFQVFSFNLAYHLDNPLHQYSEVSITIPPDTAFQKVYIQNITPKPTNVRIDSDGNWLAVVGLAPKQRVDVNVIGTVQIFASFRPFTKPTQKSLENNLKELEYWQTSNIKIIELAQKLKTVRAIYDYVSETLKYDFSRVKPDIQRMGALSVLANPNQAICMEFTDLFIAIVRAAGIPAREINGYAYTENPNLQPLGLVADVLHAWPEYYDKNKNVWIPVDPTWDSTSGGVDYFDKLDLRHFTFVIHGESSVTPYPPGSYKLGTNPQKDIFVSFGKLPNERVSIPIVTIVPVRTLPFISSIYKVTIVNPGPASLNSVNPIVLFDGKEKEISFIDSLPPFANSELLVEIPFSLLGKGTPNIVEVKVGNILARTATNKEQIIITSLLLISTGLIVLIVIILFMLKKITFGGIFATIAKVVDKIHDKFSKKPPKITDNF